MPLTNLSPDERYLNLLGINLGEAVTELNNVRQRGGTPGADLANIRFSLFRAYKASLGEAWTDVEESQVGWTGLVQTEKKTGKIPTSLPQEGEVVEETNQSPDPQDLSDKSLALQLLLEMKEKEEKEEKEKQEEKEKMDKLIEIFSKKKEEKELNGESGVEETSHQLLPTTE